MEYIKVTNWEKYQHYKNRHPPWIKLYHTLFSDYAFTQLKDASKLHIIALFSLAAQTENKIPNDPEYIKRVCNLNGTVAIEPLISAGFVTPYDHASNMLATCYQHASNMLDREETEKSRVEGDTDAFIVFPVTGGNREWTLTKAKLAEYKQSFPSLDIESEIRSALQWCRDNPTRQKTKTGMTRFLGDWLRRANDSGRGKDNGKHSNSAIDHGYRRVTV